MLLIGMTGPIGHGKSTLAKALKKIEPSTVHLESSMVIAEVANAMHTALRSVPVEGNLDFINDWLKSLPPILNQAVHTQTSYEQIRIDPQAVQEHPVEYEKLFLHVKNIIRNPVLAQQEITPENKEAYRPFLQWLGGYLVAKINPRLWYEEIIRRAYEAESRGCKLCIVGGLRYPTDAQLIRQAGGFIFKVYRPGHLQNDILDPTERERDNIQVDSTIVSNGTIEDLNKCAVIVLEDAKRNELRSVYQTLDFRDKPLPAGQPSPSA